MAHLYIHGIAIECSASEWEPVELGEITRSLNGAPRTTKRVKKRDHRFTTDVGGLLLEEAEALRALISGEGHSWSFEDVELYSSRTLLPSFTSATDIRSGDVAGKHGLGLFAEAGSTVIWPVAFDISAWTLLYWRKNGTSWVHYVVRRTSILLPLDVWQDGVLTHSGQGILGINGSGNLTFITTDSDETIDDLVALPYAVPDSWVSSLYTYRQNTEWGALPLVKASGPGVPSSGLTALGEVYAGRRVPLREAGGTFSTGEVFDFKLCGV
jgi:hypothetical protein